MMSGELRINEKLDMSSQQENEIGPDSNSLMISPGMFPGKGVAHKIHFP